jgi:hypothetical protein
VTITAGTQATQYIELPKTTAKTGQLQIRTEPSGARVTVDGIPRGGRRLPSSSSRPASMPWCSKRGRLGQGVGDRRIRRDARRSSCR